MISSWSNTIKGAIFLIGAWLVISPYALSFTNSANAMWTAIVAGAVLMVISIFSVISSAYKGYVLGLEVLVGLALILTPFVLSFTDSTAAAWNIGIAGVFTAVLGALSGLTETTVTRRTSVHTYS